MKTVSGNLLAHLQSECQTRAIIWALKLNYRRINVNSISNAANGVVTTNEAHVLSVGQYIAIDNATGMTQINDVATTGWNFHEVIAVNSPTSVTIATNTSGYGSYSGSGILHEAYGFTSHVVDLKRDGLLFRAETAFTPTASSTSDKLQVPTIEMDGVLLPLLSVDGISEDDIIGGRLDFAEVRTQTVNYESLADGGLWLNRGFIGRVTVKNDQYVAELRGLSQIASQQILELYSAGCRYDLGSTRCTVDITTGPFFVTSTISTIVEDRIQFTSGLGQAAGYFDYGKITFTTGDNSGLVMEVKTHTGGGNIELWQPLPFAFQTGDAFEAVAGCDKQLATCRDKFANLINHGGFPHLPGEDVLAQILIPKDPNVSTSS